MTLSLLKRCFLKLDEKQGNSMRAIFSFAYCLDQLCLNYYQSSQEIVDVTKSIKIKI